MCGTAGHWAAVPVPMSHCTCPSVLGVDNAISPGLTAAHRALCCHWGYRMLQALTGLSPESLALSLSTLACWALSVCTMPSCTFFGNLSAYWSLKNTIPKMIVLQWYTDVHIPSLRRDLDILHFAELFSLVCLAGSTFCSSEMFAEWACHSQI